MTMGTNNGCGRWCSNITLIGIDIYLFNQKN